MLSIPQEEREKYPPFKILAPVLDDLSLSDAVKVRTLMAFNYALGTASQGKRLDSANVRESHEWLMLKLGLDIGLEKELKDKVLKGFDEFCAAQAAKLQGRG